MSKKGGDLLPYLTPIPLKNSKVLGRGRRSWEKKRKGEDGESECRKGEEEGGIYFCNSYATVYILYYVARSISGQTGSRSGCCQI